MNTCSDLSIEQNKPKHRSNACLMDRLLLSTPLSEHHTWSFHSNSKHFETVLLYLGFSSVIWENHIEKIDYGNQTIDFMLCLFTVDSKECDHQCSECVFSGLCHTCLNRLLARSIAPTFFSLQTNFVSVRFFNCNISENRKSAVNLLDLRVVVAELSAVFIRIHIRACVRLRVSAAMF